MSEDSKPIHLTLTDAWQLEEVLRNECDPTRMDAGHCLLLRKLQDVVLDLTFPHGVDTTAGIAKYGAAYSPSADAKTVGITLEEAWVIARSLSRQAYDGARQVLLQVFFVLWQFDRPFDLDSYHLEPDTETQTDLPPFMRGFKLEENP